MEYNDPGVFPAYSVMADTSQVLKYNTPPRIGA